MLYHEDRRRHKALLGALIPASDARFLVCFDLGFDLHQRGFRIETSPIQKMARKIILSLAGCRTTPHFAQLSRVRSGR